MSYSQAVNTEQSLELLSGNILNVYQPLHTLVECRTHQPATSWVRPLSNAMPVLPARVHNIQCPQQGFLLFMYMKFFRLL